jgi:hypothetical protein
MLWLLLTLGVLTAALAYPRVGTTIVRLFALVIAVIILLPLALVVTFQRMRLKRRRRDALKARAADAANGSADGSPRLDRVIASH